MKTASIMNVDEDGYYGENVNYARLFDLVEALADELGYELTANGDLADLRSAALSGS
jgi:hypothetical protein